MYSQQYAQYSLFMFDKYQYNPAYAGMDYGLSLNAHHRSQWKGLEQSPSIVSINAHSPYYVWSGAVGIKAQSRTLGVLNYSDLSTSYNYVLNMGNGLWSNGIRVGVSSLRLDGGAIITPDGVYTSGSVNHNDPILLSETDIGLGLLWEVGTYYTNNIFEIGATLKGLPGNDISQTEFVFNKKVHAALFGQYKYKIFGEFELLQSILLNSNFNQIQTDIATVVRINGNVFGGIGLRGYNSNSLDAVTTILGVNLTDNLTLIYGYDAGISGIRQANEGSHELHINYNLGQLFGKGLPPRKVYNSRYL